MWLGVGVVPTLVVHHWDDEIAQSAAHARPGMRDAFEPGNVIGNAALQMPAATAACAGVYFCAP